MQTFASACAVSCPDYHDQPSNTSWHLKLIIGATKQCMQLCKLWARNCLVQRKSSPCHAGRKAAVAGGRLLPQLLQWRESPHLASSGQQPQGGDAIQEGCQQGCRQGQRSYVQKRKRRRVCFVCDGSLAVSEHAIFFCLRCYMTFPSAYHCDGLLKQ